jgi:hypothetical protein
MEANEDILGDLKITVDDSLLQQSLDCEPKDEEESEEQEATPHPVSTASYFEELKSKSDLKVLHERNTFFVLLGMPSSDYFIFSCQSLGLKLCFSGPTKAFSQK